MSCNDWCRSSEVSLASSVTSWALMTQPATPGVLVWLAMLSFTIRSSPASSVPTAHSHTSSSAGRRWAQRTARSLSPPRCRASIRSNRWPIHSSTGTPVSRAIDGVR